MRVVVVEDYAPLRESVVRALEAESVGRVFDRFWRGTMVEGHCGLGLALARAVVEQLGGSVEATVDGDVFTASIRLVRMSRQDGRSAHERSWR